MCDEYPICVNSTQYVYSQVNAQCVLSVSSMCTVQHAECSPLSFACTFFDGKKRRGCQFCCMDTTKYSQLFSSICIPHFWTRVFFMGSLFLGICALIGFETMRLWLKNFPRRFFIPTKSYLVYNKGHYCPVWRTNNIDKGLFVFPS